MMRDPLSTRPTKTKVESTASLQTAAGDDMDDSKKSDAGGE